MASSQGAKLAIGRLMAHGRWRPNPRSWMSETKAAPGVRFVYAATYPGVCAIVDDGVVVTIVTRDLCRSDGRRRRPASSQAPRHARLKPAPPFRWDDELEAA